MNSETTPSKYGKLQDSEHDYEIENGDSGSIGSRTVDDSVGWKFVTPTPRSKYGKIMANEIDADVSDIRFDESSFSESSIAVVGMTRNAAAQIPVTDKEREAVKLELSAIEQLRAIVTMGLPICVERTTSFLPGFTLIIFLGALGPDYIAGAGTGIMYANVTGLSVFVGFALSIPPLVSQAYGAGNYPRCGDLLQRQLAMHLILLCPLVFMMWSNAEAILIACHQPPEVAALATEFLRWRLPALPFMALSENLNYFLKAQKVVLPPMKLMLVLNAAGVLFAWLLITPAGFGLGFKGAPLALTLVNILQGGALAFFLKGWLPNPQAWPRWSARTAFRGWREIANIAVPAALGVWAEW